MKDLRENTSTCDQEGHMKWNAADLNGYIKEEHITEKHDQPSFTDKAPNHWMNDHKNIFLLMLKQQWTGVNTAVFPGNMQDGGHFLTFLLTWKIQRDFAWFVT